MKTKLIYSLMFADNENEVHKAISENLETLFEYPELWIFIRNANRRIRRIKREKQKSWMLAEMN